jgi:hypothetical protein
MARISSYPVVTPKTIDTLIISQGYDIDADNPIEGNPTGSVTIGSVIDLVNTGLVPGTGTVTSLGVSMPSAFTVSNSPVTSTGVINITGSGTSTQYIDGTGSLQLSPNQSLNTTDNVVFNSIAGDGALVTNIDKYTTSYIDSNIYTKTEANELFSSGFVGAISPTSSAPTQNGLYSCTQSGTYTNFGGEVVSLSNQVVSIAVEGAQNNVFSQIITPTGITFDSTPTAGSTNAVESGGVHSELSPLKEFVEELRELGVNIYNEDNFQEGRIDTTTGLIVDSSNAFHRTSGYISVLPNTIYTLSGRNSYKETAFYDINKNLLPSAGADYGLNIPAKNSTFTTPSNAHFFRMVVSITEPQLDDNIQLELGSSASVYEAFNINLKDYYNKTYIDSSLSNLQEVDHNRASFISVGKNLFNKDVVTSGYGIYSNGDLYIDSSLSVSEYIPVEPNTIYARTSDSASIQYNSNKEMISGSGFTNAAPYLITTDNDAAYVRVSLVNTLLDSYQFEEGSSATTYEKYTLRLLYPEDDSTGDVQLIAPGDTSFVTTGKNLFNKDVVISGYGIYSNGDLYVDSLRSVSDYIPVKPNTIYARTSDSASIQYNSNKEMISGTGFSNVIPYLITTDADAAYVRVSTTNILLDEYQFEEGSARTTYESYYVKFINEELVPYELPSYALDLIDTASVKIVELNSTKRYLNIAFSTDQHVNKIGNTTLSEEILVKIANDGILNAVVLGGDLIQKHNLVNGVATQTSKVDAIKACNQGNRILGNINIPTYYAVGNHDRNWNPVVTDVTASNYVAGADYTQGLTSTELYSLFNARLENNPNVVFNDNVNAGNYYYIDYPKYKIRLCILDVFERPLSITTGGNDFASTEQLDFIENTMLDLSSKGADEGDWEVLIMAHTDFSAVNDIVTAFVTGGGNVIAYIRGHSHTDFYDTSQNFNIIHTDASENYATETGKVGEICFDVFTIDQDQKKIYATRLGSGSDRVFNY